MSMAEDKKSKGRTVKMIQKEMISGLNKIHRGKFFETGLRSQRGSLVRKGSAVNV